MEGELKLQGLDKDVNKLDYLPLLLKGKAAYFAEVLRGKTTWQEAQDSFVDEFTVDPNVVLGELRALRCTDYNV